MHHQHSFWSLQPSVSWLLYPHLTHDGMLGDLSKVTVNKIKDRTGDRTQLSASNFWDLFSVLCCGRNKQPQIWGLETTPMCDLTVLESEVLGAWRVSRFQVPQV